MGWFSKTAEEKSKEVKLEKIEKAASAYTRVKSRNARRKGIGLGENEGITKSFLDESSEMIEEYVSIWGSDPKGEIGTLVKDYYLLYPKRKKKTQPSDEGQGASASPTVQKKPQEPQEDTAEEEQTAPAPKKTNKVGAAFEEALGETLSKTDLHQEIGKEDSEKAQKGINPAAMKGMREISDWMIRNSVKTGGYFGDNKIDFVHTYLLKQPARVKLLAYYLVETDKRKASGEAMTDAIFQSQTDYVPNLSKFKDKMIATKFKFWTRINANHFYWDKISQSMRFAVDHVAALIPFGGMQIMDTTGSSSAGKAEEQQGEGQEQEQKGQKTEDASGFSEEDTVSLSELVGVALARRNIHEEFVAQGKKLANFQAKLRAMPRDERKAREKEASEALRDFMACYKRLAGADKKVEAEFEAAMKAGKFQGSAQINNVDDSKTIKASSYIDKGSLVGLAGTIGKAGSRLYKDPEFVKKYGKYMFWGVDKIDKKALDNIDIAIKVGAGINMLGSGISLVSTVCNIADAIAHHNTTTTATKIAKGFEVSQGLVSGLGGIASGATQMAIGDTAKTVAGTATSATATAVSIAGGVTGAVTGGFAIASGIATASVAGYQKHQLTAVSKEFEQRTDLSDSERKRAQDIARLGKRLQSTKQMNASIKIVTGSMQLVGGVLTASVVGSIVGPVISGLGSFLNLSTLIVSYFRKKMNINDSIDEYINMDLMYSKVVEKLLGSEGQLKYEDKIKDQLRVEASARLGYPSKESLYNGIIYKYAEEIYNRIFYMKGIPGNPPTDAKTADGHYVKLLSGLGLKPDYKTRKPSISAIAKSLRNV